MSPPPCSDSPSARSSTSGAGMPDRLSASPTAYLARSKARTSRSVPLRAVPIAVRAAATITASGIGALLPGVLNGGASVPDVRVSLQCADHCLRSPARDANLPRGGWVDVTLRIDRRVLQEIAALATVVAAFVI